MKIKTKIIGNKKFGFPEEKTDKEKAIMALGKIISEYNRANIGEQIIPSFNDVVFEVFQKTAKPGTYADYKYEKYQLYKYHLNIRCKAVKEFGKDKKGYKNSKSVECSGEIHFEDITNDYGFQDVNVTSEDIIYE
jgi:hypothetical protein